MGVCSKEPLDDSIEPLFTVHNVMFLLHRAKHKGMLSVNSASYRRTRARHCVRLWASLTPFQHISEQVFRFRYALTCIRDREMCDDSL